MSCKIRIKKNKTNNINERVNLKTGSSLYNDAIKILFNNDTFTTACSNLEEDFNHMFKGYKIGISCNLEKGKDKRKLLNSDDLQNIDSLAEEDKKDAENPNKIIMHFINAINGTLAEDIFESYTNIQQHSKFERTYNKNTAPDFYWYLEINEIKLKIPLDIKKASGNICKGSLKAGQAINKELVQFNNSNISLFDTFHDNNYEYKYINQLLFIINFNNNVIDGCKIIPLIICMPKKLPDDTTQFALKLNNPEDIKNKYFSKNVSQNDTK